MITNVHGTFAPRAPWAKPDSKFSKGIAEQLELLHRPVKITNPPFSWTGHNDPEARIRAGFELVTFLQRQFDDFPDHDHFLVAHSHGGNISLYAQRDPVVQKRLAGIITLGTPFLECTRRPLGNLAEAIAALWQIAYVLLTVVVAVLGLELLFWLDRFHGNRAGILIITWFLGLSCFLNFLDISYKSKGKYLFRASAKRVQEKVSKWVDGKQQKIMDRLDVSGITCPPLLSFSVKGDEALWGLSFMQLIGNWTPRLVKPLTFLLPLVSLLSGLCFGPALIFMYLVGKMGGRNPPTWTLYPLAVFLTIFMVTAAAASFFCLLFILSIFIQKLIRTHRLGFGPESIADNLVCNIVVSMLPTTIPCEHHHLHPGKGINHCSFFENGEVHQAIAYWINGVDLPRQDAEDILGAIQARDRER